MKKKHTSMKTIPLPGGSNVVAVSQSPAVAPLVSTAGKNAIQYKQQSRDIVLALRQPEKNEKLNIKCILANDVTS